MVLFYECQGGVYTPPGCNAEGDTLAVFLDGLSKTPQGFRVTHQVLIQVAEDGPVTITRYPGGYSCGHRCEFIRKLIDFFHVCVYMGLP